MKKKAFSLSRWVQKDFPVRESHGKHYVLNDFIHLSSVLLYTTHCRFRLSQSAVLFLFLKWRLYCSCCIFFLLLLFSKNGAAASTLVSICTVHSCSFRGTNLQSKLFHTHTRTSTQPHHLTTLPLCLLSPVFLQSKQTSFRVIPHNPSLCLCSVLEPASLCLSEELL